MNDKDQLRTVGVVRRPGAVRRPGVLGWMSVPTGSAVPGYVDHPVIARARHLAALHLPDPVTGCPRCGTIICPGLRLAVAYLDRYDRDAARTIRRLLASVGIWLTADPTTGAGGDD
ncbi:hypothetical protein [Solwaraspora sp. WMMD792]|uniref:hypothetical protein n=1 Tax=Solwaraspora sp. WMMD792 TaxID=3016099 RepID=UPI002415EBE8|nr:hypothetical protein [Solwaraspora sp. WMMD792]MDG4769583.1 hypothetical protein [Solwaraspora sp. WMMD792]